MLKRDYLIGLGKSFLLRRVDGGRLEEAVDDEGADAAGGKGDEALGGQLDEAVTQPRAVGKLKQLLEEN